MKKSNDDLSIRDLADLFAPKLWLITLVGLVLALVLGAYSAFVKKPTYSSDASLIISKQSTTINSNDIDTVYKMLDACIEIMRKDAFLKKVASDVNSDENFKDSNITPKYISSVTSIGKLNGTEVFEIKVTTTNPSLSLAIAKAFSDNILSYLPDNLLPYPKGHVQFKMVEEPETAMRNSKNVVRNSVLGFASGVVATMLVIFIYSMFDVVVRDKKKLEDNFDIPVLGVIPEHEVSFSEIGEA